MCGNFIRTLLGYQVAVEIECQKCSLVQLETSNSCTTYILSNMRVTEPNYECDLGVLTRTYE